MRSPDSDRSMDAGSTGAAQCAEFTIGPAKGRTRWLIAPYGPVSRASLLRLTSFLERVPCRAAGANAVPSHAFHGLAD
jgi:hypothetical protein